MLLLLLFSLKINDASNIKHIQNRDATQQFQMQTFSWDFRNDDMYKVQYQKHYSSTKSLLFKNETMVSA